MNRFSFFLLLLLAFHLSFSQDVIYHMEPPNWWVGMDSKEIQLMVHGNSIRDLDVTIDDHRIRINNIYRPENSNYLFIYLQILDDPLAFDFEIVFSKEGVVYEKCIYQLFNK